MRRLLGILCFILAAVTASALVGSLAHSPGADLALGEARVGKLGGAVLAQVPGLAPVAIVSAPGRVTYATWSSTFKASQVTLSANSLTATHGTFGSNTGVRATVGVSSKKWFWVDQVTSGTMANTFGVGICTSTYDPSGTDGSTWIGNSSKGFALKTSDGTKWHNNASSSYGSGLSVNDYVATALDMDNAKVWWGKLTGGTLTWFNSGDPAAGTNPAYTSSDGITGTMYPCSGNGTSANSFVWTANFGASAFPSGATVPSGFNSGLYN